MDSDKIQIKLLETYPEIEKTEEIQRLVWPGSDTDIVPAHVTMVAADNGGVVLGAYDGDEMIGFAYGFLGAVPAENGLRIKHCSHQLGVLPAYRALGVGYKLKRAQWQIVRNQGIDLITWTYDPLMSQNANLNIAKLGAVCNIYKREYYGEMRDGLNVGIPSDRFQVDWWVDSDRVRQRLSRQARKKLDLAHYLAAETFKVNTTRLDEQGLAVPEEEKVHLPVDDVQPPVLVMVEIPADYLALKAADHDLAVQWRLHSRAIFEALFARSYLVTDYVYLPGNHPRGYYILSHGNSTLGA
jgi:predicted GNAT superfamily acetyltransferase